MRRRWQPSGWSGWNSGRPGSRATNWSQSGSVSHDGSAGTGLPRDHRASQLHDHPGPAPVLLPGVPNHAYPRDLLARAFTDLLRHRRGFLLGDWIRQAERTAPPPIKGFAGFLRQDLDAVLAGLTLDYSSGRVEGHVNRLKTLKRQMFNRAGLPLLRKRVLLA
ncbi:transposase [Streptomyces sp. NBC_01236]|uniref:transposase n=1 Tax=Streptomyces sp. NBC_01236 TaxID=2903789 RepID=UPI002E11E7F0|nr:transposase [Streptomyces sp. NBC_01236]